MVFMHWMEDVMKTRKLLPGLFWLGFALGLVLIYGPKDNQGPTIIALIVVSFVIAALLFWRNRR